MKLTYTEEMNKQDELWKSENEDTKIMENLFNEIMDEAKKLGFNGYYLIYQGALECICELYDSKEEYEECCKGEASTEFMFGYCKPLIKCLEEHYL